MKSRADENESARQPAKVGVRTKKATGRGSVRRRCRCSSPGVRRELHDEVREQFAEAADVIVRASVEKAKAGNLQHVRWLHSIIREQEAQQAAHVHAAEISLGQMLLDELAKKL